MRFILKNRKLCLKKFNVLYLFGSVTSFRNDLALLMVVLSFFFLYFMQNVLDLTLNHLLRNNKSSDWDKNSLLCSCCMFLRGTFQMGPLSSQHSYHIGILFYD